MSKLKNLNTGDKVWCGGDSGFCHSDIVLVTGTSFKYDENTGEKYKVIHINKSKYDSRTGGALNPPWAYYIKAI